VHFTGSTDGVRSHLGEGRARASARGATGDIPRLVGETGGKDFVFAHPSADVDALAVAIVRGAYEYQGQKCSAASRVYVPGALWARGARSGAGDAPEVRVGDVTDFRNFMGAVIDRRAYDRLTARCPRRARRPGLRGAPPRLRRPRGVLHPSPRSFASTTRATP
jgi:1-pyrroline-5-carboxylate dehydrogenase